MSPAITRNSPGTVSVAPLIQAITGLSGVIASSPGSSPGSARRRATSCRKSSSSGTTGMLASSRHQVRIER